jgi:hypothetical protein
VGAMKRDDDATPGAILNRPGIQGCQIVYLRPKNRKIGIFLEGLGMEKFGIGILWPFG